MTPTLLLQKLIDLERSIGTDTNSVLRGKVVEAQQCLLQLQGERLKRPFVQEKEKGRHRFALLRAFSDRKAAGN